MDKKIKVNNKLYVVIIIILICLTTVFLSIAGYAYAKYMSRASR